jgi:hypothetical protein
VVKESMTVYFYDYGVVRERDRVIGSFDRSGHECQRFSSGETIGEVPADEIAI